MTVAACQELYATMMGVMSNNVKIKIYEDGERLMKNRQVYVDKNISFMVHESSIVLYTDCQVKYILYVNNNISVPGLSDQQLIGLLNRCIEEFNTRFYVK